MKKLCLKAIAFDKPLLHKLIIMSKLCLLLIISSVFTLQARNSYSQQVKLNLELKNASLNDVVNAIKNQTEFEFAYDSNLESVVLKNVSVKAKNESIDRVMATVLEGTDINFKVFDRIILLSRNNVKTTSGIESRMNMQKIRITGIITDSSTGEPLPGVNVTMEGTTVGTITDIDGKYSLEVPQENGILVYSFVGYLSEKIQIQGQINIDVKLVPEIKSLEEVVVVGYGTVKKKDLTGSVGSIEASVITSTSSSNATNALQGRIAGVNIERNVGKPGGDYDIKVRGLSSIKNSNTGPLYVIDGIPTTEGLNDLNPNDIEKIDILKDASATAIYGSRGANGVIIVSTKKGKEGKLAIQYEGYYGYRVASNQPNMMNGEEYVKWRTDLYTNLGRSTDRTNADFFTPEEWSRIDNGQYTDWIDLVQKNGVQMSNTLTATGGDEKGAFAMSIGQLKEEGTVPGQDFNRYNMRLNVNRKFLKKWEAGGNLYFTYSVQDEGSYETLRSAYRLPPVASAYDENGNKKFYAYRNDAVTNPLFEYASDGELRENRRYRAFGNIYLQVEPIKGLTLRSQLSPQMIYKRNGFYQGQYSKGAGGKIANTRATYLTNDYFGYVIDNQANYVKSLGIHNLNFSFVQSIQAEQWEEANQDVRNFPYNSEWYNTDAVAKTDISAAQTDFRKRTLVSYLGRFQYTLNDKYLFTVSGRYDGSSRLAEGNKWAFFPSAAFAWRMSEESFMKNIKSLTNLKLRLSYGVTGNDAVDIYGTQATVSKKYYDYGGTVSTAYYKNRLANYDLTWEKTTEFNLGVDYGLFDNKINGSIDVYQRDAKDLIMERQLPQTAGWTSVWDNVGWVRNKGIEIGLNTVNIETKNFSWNTNIIFDSNKNEIMELYGAKKDDVGNKWFIGKPIQVNYDYEFDGIWQTSEADEAAKYGQTPGQVKVKDLDNNGVIDANDKKVIGQLSPKWSGSITNTFKYKNWDLSANVYTRQGAQLYSTFVSTFMSLEGNYKNVDIDYWTPNNPSNKYPQPGNKGKYFDVTRYCDVSFVRVGNITLGYTLPKNLLNRVHVNKLRVYFTTNNPFTFTSYPGYDPEWADQNTWGEASGFTTYLFGINLEL
jgi:TonB-linked SusC/RagA family outer membrane protein